MKHHKKARALGALSLLLAGACSKHEQAAAGLAAESTTSQVATSPAAPPAPAANPKASPQLRHGLPWYEDAPEAALADARASNKLVLVDLWAPWCHTCLSMQSFVLNAENLPNVASRFVLLAVDTERAENAAFLERLPVGVWPTFYVVSPERAQVLGRWLGAASPAQFVRFLAEAERAAALSGHDPSSQGDPLALLVVADEQATRGELAAAAATYGKALAVAPAGWPRRPETLVARITALYKSQQDSACLELAGAAAADTGASASAVDFADYALACAERSGGATPQAQAVRRSVEHRLTSLCEQGSPELTPDDHADACAKLADARTALGDAGGAKRALLARLGVLEAAVKGKPPEAQAPYDWAFTDTLLALGRAEQALARSTQRERELPGDYNPAQHQARAYKELGRHAEGLAAIERALALAYGPRKIGFLTLKADLLIGTGQEAAAKQLVQEQLAAYRALPAGQRQPAAEARVQKRLADWK